MEPQSCQHNWAKRTSVSKRLGTQRYQCASCGLWAYRAYANKAVVIRPYETPITAEILKAWHDEIGR